MFSVIDHRMSLPSAHAVIWLGEQDVLPALKPAFNEVLASGDGEPGVLYVVYGEGPDQVPFTLD